MTHKKRSPFTQLPSRWGSSVLKALYWLLVGWLHRQTLACSIYILHAYSDYRQALLVTDEGPVEVTLWRHHELTSSRSDVILIHDESLSAFVFLQKYIGHTYIGGLAALYWPLPHLGLITSFHVVSLWRHTYDVICFGQWHILGAFKMFSS